MPFGTYRLCQSQQLVISLPSRWLLAKRSHDRAEVLHQDRLIIVLIEQQKQTAHLCGTNTTPLNRNGSTYMAPLNRNFYRIRTDLVFRFSQFKERNITFYISIKTANLNFLSRYRLTRQTVFAYIFT